MYVFLQEASKRLAWNGVDLEELLFPAYKELTIGELCVLLWQQL